MEAVVEDSIDEVVEELETSTTEENFDKNIEAVPVADDLNTEGRRD